MLYELAYERLSAQDCKCQPLEEVVTQVVDAPAYRVVGGGIVRFSDRFLRYIFDVGHGMGADTVTVAQYWPPTVRGDTVTGNRSMSLCDFNLGAMRRATAKLSAEIEQAFG